MEIRKWTISNLIILNYQIILAALVFKGLNKSNETNPSLTA